MALFSNKRTDGIASNSRSDGGFKREVEKSEDSGEMERIEGAGPRPTGKPYTVASQPETVTFDELPESWTVWSDEPDGRSVLAYRPDVFDGERYPAACMPTVYLAPGAPNRPPGEHRTSETTTWHVTLTLEPEVEMPGSRTFETREAALDGAVELAEAFAAGEFDYRDWYQMPRESYLDRLDGLTGRDA